MIGKILGAIAGQRISKDFSGISGSGGALMGVGAATLLRRLSPLTIVAFAIGGYAAKKSRDKKSDIAKR
ncbi:hypothetical protein WBP06_04130 [Novosphingobium sp. BL-8H]|uniref:hypothetical protein n=1 Tax=Novosphingobium sp. BL-8H TaxID=3127640 RepID=UPI0037573A48